MIKFEILKSPDSNVVGLQLFGGNVVTFSNSLQSMVYIADFDFSSFELSIKKDGKLKSKTNSISETIIIDDKKISGSKTLNKNSTICSGKTTLTILDYKFEPYLLDQEEVDEQLLIIENDRPDISKLLDGFHKAVME